MRETPNPIHSRTQNILRKSEREAKRKRKKTESDFVFLLRMNMLGNHIGIYKRKSIILFWRINCSAQVNDVGLDFDREANANQHHTHTHSQIYITHKHIIHIEHGHIPNKIGSNVVIQWCGKTDSSHISSKACGGKRIS